MWAGVWGSASPEPWQDEDVTRAPGAALLAMTAVSVLDSSDGHATAMKHRHLPS